MVSHCRQSPLPAVSPRVSPMMSAVRRRLLLSLPIRFFTAATASAGDPTVSYLISRCALSPAVAARAAPSIRLVSPASTARADAVLALLRRYGFTGTDIAVLVRKFPIVLASKPDKTLQPKLDFFVSVGVTAPLLPKLFSACPMLIHRSIQDHLVPLFDSLREVLGSDSHVVKAFRQMPFAIRCNPRSTLFLVLPALRDVHGVPPRDISKLVALSPGVIMQRPDRVDKIVRDVKSFGLEPGHPMFIHVFALLCKISISTLERKFAVFQSLGFDKDSITLMLRRYPSSMGISEEKIKKNVGFLVSKAGLSLEDMVTYPTVLVRSLESLSRRCALLAVLRREGKPAGHHRVPVVLVHSLKRFLDGYVHPHQDEIPDVSRALSGEIPFEGFAGLVENSRPPRKTSL